MPQRRPSPVDPTAYQKIVGATFARAEHKPLVTIGSRAWSKYDLGRLGCPHPAAATRVARLIQQLEIRTATDFLNRAHEFGGYKTVGVTCYWLVLALARDLGGDIDTVHNSDHSFHAIHAKALKADAPSPRRTRRTRS
jgi:hypothetical protein